MQDDIVARVANNPKYQELKSKRSSYSWVMTILMMIAYYGFILLVGYNRELLGTKLGGGVITLGIPLGLGVLVFTIIITNIYIRRANTEFDELTAQIVKDATK
jgi:uncharacterized membrane protein (DUF485 family)